MTCAKYFFNVLKSTIFKWCLPLRQIRGNAAARALRWPCESTTHPNFTSFRCALIHRTFTTSTYSTPCNIVTTAIEDHTTTLQTITIIINQINGKYRYFHSTLILLPIFIFVYRNIRYLWVIMYANIYALL